jgi:hypothetical protein
MSMSCGLPVLQDDASMSHALHVLSGWNCYVPERKVADGFSQRFNEAAIGRTMVLGGWGFACCPTLAAFFAASSGFNEK